MKRAALARKTPLRARARMRPRRATPRRSERVRDTDYLLAVKRLPCAAAGMFGAQPEPGAGLYALVRAVLNATPDPCEGVIEADHAGVRPLGRKCSDDEAIPLCTKHHRQRTDHTGVFRRFTKAQMRAWLRWAITRTQTRLRRTS